METINNYKYNGKFRIASSHGCCRIGRMSTAGNGVQQSETLHCSKHRLTNEQPLLSLRYNNEYDNYDY